MAVINIMKDGTIIDDMSTVIIPKEKVEEIVKIIEQREREKEWMKN